MKRKSVRGLGLGRKAPRITVGCDPEFEFVRGSNIVTPESTTTVYGSLGSDCNAMEIRPEAAERVGTVLQNIHALFSLAYAQRGRVMVSGNTLPLGGHIHIGGITNEKQIQRMVSVLDDFIGRPLAPINGKRRGPESCAYGRYSDYETKPYGFEYRTPPSAFFHNPQFTGLVFSLARSLAQEFASRKEVAYEVDDRGAATARSIADRIGRKRAGMLMAHVERYGTMMRNSQSVEIDRDAWRIGETDTKKYGSRPVLPGGLSFLSGVPKGLAAAFREKYERAGLKCAMLVVPDTDTNIASTHAIGPMENISEMLEDGDVPATARLAAKRAISRGTVVMSLGVDIEPDELGKVDSVDRMLANTAKMPLKKRAKDDVRKLVLARE